MAVIIGIILPSSACVDNAVHRDMIALQPE
jgi:hypothetical protein